jgi:hypothetical protein
MNDGADRERPDEAQQPGDQEDDGDGVQQGDLSLSGARSSRARQTGGGESDALTHPSMPQSRTRVCAFEQVPIAESVGHGQPNRDRMTSTFRLNEDDAHDGATPFGCRQRCTCQSCTMTVRRE